MSSEARARLAWLEGEITRHAATLLAGASECPPGGDRAWDQLLGAYRVPPLSPADRVSEVVGRAMTRGAVPTELRRALESLATWARAELAPLAPALVFDARFGSVQQQIARLAAEADQYESRMSPPPAPSVGSIFANATATAGKAPWSAVKVPASSVFVCETCGAPQQTPLQFNCKYCSNPMMTRRA